VNNGIFTQGFVQELPPAGAAHSVGKRPFGSACRSFADRGTSSLQIDLWAVYRAAAKE
jgi:hypothetical protein